LDYIAEIADGLAYLRGALYEIEDVASDSPEVAVVRDLYVADLGRFVAALRAWAAIVTPTDPPAAEVAEETGA
jgi:hypothetical protein